jgi:hypothetical protein
MAKLVEHLLATAALWVRIKTSQKTNSGISTKCTKALQSMYRKVEYINQVFRGLQSFSSARRMTNTKFASIFDRSLQPM